VWSWLREANGGFERRLAKLGKIVKYMGVLFNYFSGVCCGAVFGGAGWAYGGGGGGWECGEGGGGVTVAHLHQPPSEISQERINALLGPWSHHVKSKPYLARHVAEFIRSS
jgi:hypothetical protein